MRTAIRIFVSLWYLLGWILHVYLGMFAPELYRSFGNTALIPGYATFWNDVIMPRIGFFALLLAAFEILVGGCLISRGKWVKYGLGLSILFNLFLVQMGLSWPAGSAFSDFLVNRIPNLIFIALQLPLLLWGWDRSSVPELLFRREGRLA